MTLDQLTQELKYQAAKFLFNKADTSEISRLLNDVMALGIYHDEFLLVIDGDDYKPGYGKSLASALERLGTGIPSNIDYAAWDIIRHHLQKIADGKEDPFDRLTWLMDDIYRDYDFSGGEYVGDRIGLSNLVGAYWTLDEWQAVPPHTKEIDDLRNEIRHDAETWLRDWSHSVPSSSKI